jgi:hypothetical protein
MTFDPYTNRIPHGLLTEEEKAALKATGGPWEFRYPIPEGWLRLAAPEWSEGCTYRAVRKSLPVPQEGDVWVDSGDYLIRNAHPDDNVMSLRAAGCRLFREVKA